MRMLSFMCALFCIWLYTLRLFLVYTLNLSLLRWRFCCICCAGFVVVVFTSSSSSSSYLVVELSLNRCVSPSLSLSARFSLFFIFFSSCRLHDFIDIDFFHCSCRVLNEWGKKQQPTNCTHWISVCVWVYLLNSILNVIWRIFLPPSNSLHLSPLLHCCLISMYIILFTIVFLRMILQARAFHTNYLTLICFSLSFVCLFSLSVC